MNQFFTNILDRFNLYPITIRHILYIVVATLITTVITSYFLRFKLLKWIYIGTVIVLAATMYKTGNDTELVNDIYKLATV